MPPKAKQPAEAPEVQETEIAAPEAPAADVAEQETVDEAAVAEEPAEAPEEAVEADDGALLEINAAVRPMRHADGDGSCDLYRADKVGNILVPASEVPAMIEHGFVLVDDEA